MRMHTLGLAMLFAACLAGGEPVVAPAVGYQLFPGDRISVQVFGHPDLTVDARVPQAGGVTFPLIGVLDQLAGRTPQALADLIATRLADGFVRSPSVTVQVVEYGSRRAVVMGAVRTPGPIPLDPLRPSGAWQAIGTAGGFEDDADQMAVVVLREDALQGRVPLRQAMAGTLPASGDVLINGDIVIVPRTDRIYVLGEVNTPRALPMPAGEVLSVSKAISMAGGFARFAKDARVQLLRRDAPPVTVNVRAVLDGDKNATDPPLRAGDTVFVPESRY